MTFVNYWLQERLDSLSCRLLRFPESFRSIGDAFQSGKLMIVGQVFPACQSYVSVTIKDKNRFSISHFKFFFALATTVHRLESGLVRLASWGTSTLSKQRNRNS